MEKVQPSNKEVYISKFSGDWTEITINTGGIACTLQDIKAQQRSGGFVYRNLTRFIYWRTTHDVLELVEESFDTRLLKNQLRYTFTDSPILEGVSITEWSRSIVVLVPTLCSVHKLIFPHPEEITRKETCGTTTYSVFHAAQESDALNPTTFHVLNNITSSVISGASCLTSKGKAIFALSLKDCHIKIIILHLNNNPVPQVLNLTRSYSFPFMTGLSGLMGKGKHMHMSILFEKQVPQNYKEDSTVLLHSLDSDGNLTSWNCSNWKQSSQQLFKSSNHLAKHASGHVYKLCSTPNNSGGYLFAAFYQGEISIFSLRNDVMNLVRQLIPTSENLTLQDLTFGGCNTLCCSWLTENDTPCITQLTNIHEEEEPEWTSVILARITHFDYPGDIALDPAQHYLNKIMNCGFCRTADLDRTLSVLKSTKKIASGMSLREKIHSIVGSEISCESVSGCIDEADLSVISERVWIRLYRCCMQYLSTVMTVCGLVWIPVIKSLVLIKPHGYSLVRDLTDVEVYVSLPPDISSHKHSFTSVFHHIKQHLEDEDSSEILDQLEMGLHLGDELQPYLVKAIESVPINSLTDVLEACRSAFSELRNLEKLYNELSFSSIPDSTVMECNGFSSDAGIIAVTTIFEDICFLRLRVCECLTVMAHAAGVTVPRDVVRNLHLLCKVYKLLVWLCRTPVHGHPSIIQSFYASHSRIGKATIISSFYSLLSTVWPITNSERIAQHLLSIKRYDLIHIYANLWSDHSSWSMILLESYLAANEPHKAFFLVDYSNLCDSRSVYYQKAFSLFDKYGYSEFIVKLVDTTLPKVKVFPDHFEFLISLKFTNQCKLGHYSDAFTTLLQMPDRKKKSDLFQNLVLEMIGNSRFELFPTFAVSEFHLELVRHLKLRCETLEVNRAEVFYNILYLIHMKRKEFKKAAALMFEQSERAETCEDQLKSLAMAYNCLKLLDPPDAFVQKPTKPLGSEFELEFVDVKEVGRLLEAAKYRYYLNAPPDEPVRKLVSSCVDSKLFTKAMHLASVFNLDCSFIMKAFATEVIRLADPNPCLSWLATNVEDQIECEEGQENIIKTGWKLLHLILEKYEKPCETYLHKAVTEQLLSMNFFLPTALTDSYKKRDVSELMRLYKASNQLQAAGSLASDTLLDALVDNVSSVLNGGPPLCLPINVFDSILREMKNSTSYQQEAKELESALEDYIEAIRKCQPQPSVLYKNHIYSKESHIFSLPPVKNNVNL